jgi:YEATS domain-containing protein 4
MPDVAANPTADPATLYAPPPTASTSTSTPGDPNAPANPQPLLEPVHSWQYDEIVFTDPPKAFLDILLANPPTPLPKMKKRPIPPNPAHVPSLGPQPSVPGTPTKGSGGNMPEFTQVLERDEAERLDAAKRAVVDATDAQRVLLIEKEREFERLRRELET